MVQEIDRGSRRIAVVGSMGQLGSDLVQVLTESGRYEVSPISQDQMDVTDRGNVMRVLADDRFDVVINCSAFTWVDECEDHPGEALQVNAQGAFEVARACSEVGSLCVFISTDYVFSGDKGGPYMEEDKPDPINVYGVSKLAGELLVQQAAPHWLIVRIASVFGKSGARRKGGNFIETILSKVRSKEPVRVVNDIWMSPTYTMDVAGVLDELIQINATGLYHAANSGRCTWHEFAHEAVRLIGLDTLIEPITCDAYPTRARRPKDSSMESVRLLDTLGHSLRPWQEALRAYLVEKGYVQS